MNLYIDKCIAKYKELFSSDGISKVITKINTDNSKEIEKPDNDNSKEIGNDNVNETVLLKEKFDEFERFFHYKSNGYECNRLITNRKQNI